MSDKTCEQCDTSFRTLTKLRLHQDECGGSTDELDHMPDVESGVDILKRIAYRGVTCQECGTLFEDEDALEIEEGLEDGFGIRSRFTCNECGTENEVEL